MKLFPLFLALLVLPLASASVMLPIVEELEDNCVDLDAGLSLAWCNIQTLSGFEGDTTNPLSTEELEAGLAAGGSVASETNAGLKAMLAASVERIASHWNALLSILLLLFELVQAVFWVVVLAGFLLAPYVVVKGLVMVKRWGARLGARRKS